MTSDAAHGDQAVNTATIRCVLCGAPLSVDPLNLAYPSADGHSPHDPYTGEPRLFAAPGGERRG